MRRSERSTRGIGPERFQHSARMATEGIEPKTVDEALSGPNKELWIKAMDDEINSLRKNNTWKLEKIPRDRKVIGCKWVFKLKQIPGSKELKYKARLVAQGFSQHYGSDYNEKFAPVVRPVTLRALLVVAGKRKLFVEHYDAKTAFLNGELEETIYMRQPEGYKQNENEVACKLIKSIYGLKQAARMWNKKLDESLKKHGFQVSTADKCLYWKKVEDETIYIIVHVDDMLITSASKLLIKTTAEKLEKEFSLTNLGELSSYVGITAERDPNGIFYIHQRPYIEEIIKKFGLEDAKVSKIPLDTGYNKVQSEEEDLADNELYQRLIGALLYLAVNSRPDISASISILSQKIKKPTKRDWTELKRVVRYLKGTKDLKLKLGGNNTDGLVGFADADWAENRTDRKSNSGFIFTLNGGAISWSCRKQTCVSLFSTEAEYIALSEASQEGIWIKRMLKDLGEEQNGPIKMLEDNQSCIKLATNDKFSNRTKHIDTKYHFVKDLIEEEIIKLEYCPTESMVADMLTKPLGPLKLQNLKRQSQLMEQNC